MNFRKASQRISAQRLFGPGVTRGPRAHMGQSGSAEEQPTAPPTKPAAPAKPAAQPESRPSAQQPGEHRSKGSADFAFFEVCGFLAGRTAEFQQIETLRYLARLGEVLSDSGRESCGGSVLNPKRSRQKEAAWKYQNSSLVVL
jgi:hypothetical protein